MKQIPANDALAWFGLFVGLSLVLSVIAVVIAIRIERTYKDKLKK